MRVGESAGYVGERMRSAVERAMGELVRRGWERASRLGAIGPHDRRGRRFQHFGEGSGISFPVTALYGERWMRIGSHTLLGPRCSLSAGLAPDQKIVNDPAVVIGDRCMIGASSGIVSHHEIVIGNDVWTGHQVYITDANHGYEDVTEIIGRQLQPARPVSIGDGCWLGHGSTILPGARLGRHVVVAAGAVVSGIVPDFSVVAGVPARVIRRWSPDAGWEWVDRQPR
jgi:acetyltransferase-like isoleucine patch superfamily enzyme